jgi:photosystem II stability/assembly factor-like uncharacterized protein
MTLHQTFIAAAFFSATAATIHAQQWELVTPLKTRSELVGLRMTSALTGYMVDRPMRSILKTSNAGVDWKRKANNLNATPNAIWMWDDQRGIVAGNSGVFYHTDNGFDNITATSVFGAGHASAIYFVNDTLGFTGTEDGQIYRTIDGGATWTEQVAESTGQVFCFFFVDELLGFASAGADLYRTMDGGVIWESLLTPELVNVQDMHFFDAQHGIGVGSLGIIIKTDNGGDTWMMQDSPTTYTMVDLYVQDDVLFACGASGRTIRSTNGGDTWTETVTDGRERLAVDFGGAGIGVMTGSAGYIYRSMDLGATWEVINRGVPHTGFNKVAFADNGIGIAVGSSGLNGFESGYVRTTDGGRHWSGSLGGGIGIHLRNDGVGVIGANHTADYFETIQIGLSAPQVVIRCVQAFTPSTYIVAGGNLAGGFYRTINGGGAWTYTQAGNPYDMYFPTELVGYAAGEGYSVYKTIDGGVNWIDQGPQVPGQQFTVFFHDELHGWTGGAGAGSRTVDGGGTWVTMGSIPSYTKSIIFTDADTGYAVGQGGETVRSTDGGITWVGFIPGIGNATFGDAALVDGALIGVANNGDIYRAQLSCPVNGAVPSVLQVDGELCTGETAGVQWYLDDDPIDGATSSCYNPASAGSYHVVTSDAQGCFSAPSEAISILSTALPQAVNADDLALFPNPVDGLLMIHVPHGMLVDRAEILDVQGHVVKRISSIHGQGCIDLSGLTQGIYVLRGTLDGRSVTQRFVKR